MILAIFYLQVASILHTKFWVKPPFGSGEETQNRFSRWQPSWISNQNDFSYIWSTSHPDTFYQASSQLAQGCRRSDLKQNVDIAWQTMDINWSQQLILRTACSGELKILIFFLNLFLLRNALLLSTVNVLKFPTPKCLTRFHMQTV